LLRNRQLWIENAVLSEIVAEHPDHLTTAELVIRMEEAPSDTDRVTIMDALRMLERSSLVRLNGEVVEPTHAALRAAAIFGF
jgi:hypothetical protein